jgi:hypothetical protein
LKTQLRDEFYFNDVSRVQISAIRDTKLMIGETFMVLLMDDILVACSFCLAIKLFRLRGRTFSIEYSDTNVHKMLRLKTFNDQQDVEYQYIFC